MIARKKTAKNGTKATGDKAQPRRPADARPAKAEPAASDAPQTKDPPATAKPVTNGAAKAKPAAASEATTSGDEELARRLAKGLPPRGAAASTAGDKALARRLAMGLPPRRSTGRGAAAPAPAPSKARAPPSSSDDDDDDASDAADAPAPPRPAITVPARTGPAAGAECVGARIRVWWPNDRVWYTGEVLSFDGARHTLLYDDNEEEVVTLGEERYELNAAESSSDEEESCASSSDESDDAMMDKLKFYVWQKVAGGASWSELFFDPSFERDEAELEEGRFANAYVAEQAAPAAAEGDEEEEEEEADEADRNALQLAAAYKAAWRDTGRAKRKVTKKKEGAVRWPLPRFGCPRERGRTKARAAYDRAPVRWFDEDTGNCYQDFELPLSLVVDAAIATEAEKGREKGKRSLAVALSEFELIQVSERPPELEKANLARAKACRDEFGSCGCSAKVDKLDAAKRRKTVAEASDESDDEETRTACLSSATCAARAAFVECTPRTCSLGSRCGNRRLQRWKGGGIDARDNCDERGFGLFACKNFKAGGFIGEYVGEVMRSRDYGQLRRARREKHWYFMALDKDEVVDASRRGGLTRFLNHSCSPNAECQSWTVDGEKRITIVAQRPIATDEEVTFDYSWKGDHSEYKKRASSKTSTKCWCGAAKCRGVLGDRAEDFLASLEEEDTDGGRKFFRRTLREVQAVEPCSGKVVRAAFGEPEAEAVERAVNGWRKRLQGAESSDLKRAFAAKLFLRKSVFGTSDPLLHQQRLVQPLAYTEVDGDGWIMQALHKHGGEDFAAVVRDPAFDGPRRGRTAAQLDAALDAWVSPAPAPAPPKNDGALRLAHFEAFLAMAPAERCKLEASAEEPEWSRRLLEKARAAPPLSPKSSTPPSPACPSPRKRPRSLSNGEPPSPRKRSRSLSDARRLAKAA